MDHYTVYREEGRFAGWPANYGIWGFGYEIVVGFTVGYLKIDEGFHARDRSKPFVTMLARTLDGGETWQVESFSGRLPGQGSLSADEHVEESLAIGRSLSENSFERLRQPVDFKGPGFSMMCARSGLGQGSRSWFYISMDRCKTWRGPYLIPGFGTPGIAARTDYIVEGRRRCTLFLTAAKGNGHEGRPFCIRTEDGGLSFNFLSWIGEEPKGFSIMPASVRLGDGTTLVAVRRREAEKNWIELYSSIDDCQTWRFVTTPVENTGSGGNPPTLTLLKDGRLCMTYGFRDPPYGIRARISNDGGESWGEEIILRNDGGNHDLGYPRTALRPDGRLVTVYYFNDKPDGERYIAATVWEP